MAIDRTLIRQDRQIRESEAYADTVVPSQANFETLPATLQEDLNNIRSMIHELRDKQSSNWWRPLEAPSVPEVGAARGVQQLNENLHALEQKRILREVGNLTDIIVPASNVLVLSAGQLPTQLVAAVGDVLTLGTVVAAHSGTFGDHSLDTVTGSGALSPANLVLITEGDSRETLFSGDQQIWGLLQSEFTTDGTVIDGTSPRRVQISFVRVNALGNAFEAVPIADIQGKKINYCFRERVRLRDLLEGDFLKGAFVENGAGSGGGGGSLTAKAGTLSPGLFAGNPKKSTVTFAAPYPDTNYSITTDVATANNKQFVTTYENKTANGFTINLGANNIANVIEVSWHTLPNGEV